MVPIRIAVIQPSTADYGPESAYRGPEPQLVHASLTLTDRPVPDIVLQGAAACGRIMTRADRCNASTG